MVSESGPTLVMMEQSSAWMSPVRILSTCPPYAANLIVVWFAFIECVHLTAFPQAHHTMLLSGDSKWLLTAGADSSVRLWDVERGVELFRWETHQPAKACAFAQADQRLAAFTTSAFATSMPSIRFIRIADVPSESEQNPILQIDLERTQTCALECSLACAEACISPPATEKENGSNSPKV